MSNNDDKKYEKIDLYFAALDVYDDYAINTSKEFLEKIIARRDSLNRKRVTIKLGRVFKVNEDYCKKNIDEYAEQIKATNEKKLILFLGMGQNESSHYRYLVADNTEFDERKIKNEFPYDLLKHFVNQDDYRMYHETSFDYVGGIILEGMVRKFKEKSNVKIGFTFLPYCEDEQEKIDEMIEKFPEFIKEISKKYLKNYSENDD